MDEWNESGTESCRSNNKAFDVNALVFSDEAKGPPYSKTTWKYTVGLELEHNISTDGPVLETGTE